MLTCPGSPGGASGPGRSRPPHADSKLCTPVSRDLGESGERRTLLSRIRWDAAVLDLGLARLVLLPRGCPLPFDRDKQSPSSDRRAFKAENDLVGTWRIEGNESVRNHDDT